MIPNPVGKSRFSLLARSDTASSANAPPLTGVGFYRPRATEFRMIPNPVGKSRFSFLARAGGLRPYSPTLQGAGFYRPLTTEFRMIIANVRLNAPGEVVRVRQWRRSRNAAGR